MAAEGAIGKLFLCIFFPIEAHLAETDNLFRGREGDEIEDYSYNMANPRRRSNSSTHVIKDFKTKFETVEPEPVFEEELHGPADDKESTASAESKSIDEEEANKKV